MFEGIKRKFMTTIEKRRVEALHITGLVPPFTFEKIDDALEEREKMGNDYAGGEICMKSIEGKDHLSLNWIREHVIVECEKFSASFMVIF